MVKKLNFKKFLYYIIWQYWYIIVFIYYLLCYLDLMIKLVKNIDENIMLNACIGIKTLIKDEDGALDLFLRHKGI